MFENFQLAAIVGETPQVSLKKVPLRQDVQESLSQSWATNYSDFVKNVIEIDFVPGYKPESDERFRLTMSEPPEWLRDERSETIRHLEDIGSTEVELARIRAIAGFVRDTCGREFVLMQNFVRSRVISPGRAILQERGIYVGMSAPVLVLDNKLSAVYQSDERKLLFSNFRNVNTFLPLSDVLSELSEDEIRGVLDHPLLAPEDVDVLAVDASQWFRTRFAMLSASGILDEYTADDIRAHAEGYPVQISVADGKIVFPADKSQAKRVLQFLNEELFQGAITEALYETNSKRRAD